MTKRNRNFDSECG